MNKEYLWNAEAVEGIKSKQLDKHFAAAKNRARYKGYATSAMESMRAAVDAPDQLQMADLYSVLHDLIALDAELSRALKKAGISEGRRARWISWFTWYVVNTLWEDLVND